MNQKHPVLSATEWAASEIHQASDQDLTAIRQLRDEFGEDLDCVLQAFLDNLPVRLRIMADALAEDQADKLRDVSHTLKGSCLNLGAANMAHLALKLEYCGKNRTMIEAQEWFARIEAMAQLVQSGLTANLHKGDFR